MSSITKSELVKLIETLPEDSLPAANDFLSKLIPPPPFLKLNFGSSFERDFRKEGYDLAVREDGTVEDTEFSGEVEFDSPVSFLRSGETSIDGEEMLKRALKLGANLGQRDGEKLKNWFNNTADGKKARKELQGLYIPLTGTVWVGRTSRRRCVAYLDFGSEGCYLSLFYLECGCGSGDRLLVPRKKS